jgi:hypothetical protein
MAHDSVEAFRALPKRRSRRRRGDSLTRPHGGKARKVAKVRVTLAGPRRVKGRTMRTAIAAALLVAGCSQRSTPEEHETGAFDPKDVLHESDDAVRVEVHRRAVPLQDMPIVNEMLGGLPMSGLADVSIDLSVPKENGVTRYCEATGTIAASCPAGCELGDGHARLAARGRTIDFGHITLDQVDAQIDVHDGRVDLTRFEIASSDVALHARLRIELADTFDAAAIDGCVWFNVNDSLLQRQPNTYQALMTTGAVRSAGGMFEISISGTLAGPKLRSQLCRESSAAGDAASRAPRSSEF